MKSLFQREYRILKNQESFEEKLSKEAIMRLSDYRNEFINPDGSPSALAEEWDKEIKNKSDIECIFYESAEDEADPRDLSSKRHRNCTERFNTKHYKRCQTNHRGITGSTNRTNISTVSSHWGRGTGTYLANSC